MGFFGSDSHDRTYRLPRPHPGGLRPPAIPSEDLPAHVAIVMDGNGRWAKERNLARTKGHEKGEEVLFDIVEGAVEMGIPYLSAYAFSTENWKRSYQEVSFLMGFSRQVIHRHLDDLDSLGVKIRWAGRRPRLWSSVIKELEKAEERTASNTTMTFQLCVNYGGRAEIADAARTIATLASQGKIDPSTIDEKTFRQFLDEPDIPDVDLFIRSSGEQRISNFLLWQSAYAEMIFSDVLWPDWDRTHLWSAVESYCKRDRRFGSAIPNEISSDQ